MKKKINKNTKAYAKKQARISSKKLLLQANKLTKERDNNRCIVCGIENGTKTASGSIVRLNVHHLIGREHKEYKTSVDNLVSLCSLHHQFSRIISPHHNPHNFFEWLKTNRPEQYKIMEERQKIILENDKSVIKKETKNE